MTLYLVWGSTYLAIRVAVETIPPLSRSALRFLVAGALLYLVTIRAGDAEGDRPTRLQWRDAAVVGGLPLAGGNGLLAVGEQTIPSGVAALIVATLPLWLLALATGDLLRVRVAEIAPQSLAALAYLVVVGSLVGCTACVWLLRVAPISLISTYAFVNPIVAVVLGWLILAEPLAPRTLVAGAIIVVAVAIIVRAGSGETRRPAAPGAPVPGAAAAMVGTPATKTATPG